MPESLNVLQDRIDALEGQLRSQESKLRKVSQRSIILAIVVAFLAIRYWWKSSTSATVEAQEFILRDKRGRARAQLAARQGDSSLILYDEAGNGRLVLHAWHDGSSGINVFDAKRTKRVDLGLNSDGNFSGLTFFDRNGNPRYTMGADDGTATGLTTLDETGAARLILKTNPGSSNGLVVRDRAGRNRVFIGLDQQDSPTINVESPASGKTDVWPTRK